MSWQTFVTNAPELAAFGKERLNGRVSYLATVRKDGGPRVHPVNPIIGAGRLFLFMEPTSPKGYDLRRDGRFALHCGVEDNEGGGGEFHIAGRATLVEDAGVRAVAIGAASYNPADRYILFELTIERAASLLYVDGQVVRQNWTAAGIS
jgi:hypothetical protein